MDVIADHMINMFWNKTESAKNARKTSAVLNRDFEIFRKIIINVPLKNYYMKVDSFIRKSVRNFEFENLCSETLYANFYHQYKSASRSKGKLFQLSLEIKADPTRQKYD